MSVNLRGDGWRCWRNQEHAGLKPHYLISALTGLNSIAIAALVGDQAPAIQNDFLAQVSAMFEPSIATVVSEPLEVPMTFRTLDYIATQSSPYVNYIHKRGLLLPDIAPYKLWYAARGEQAGRIIFPVRDTKARLMGWTGRHVGKSSLRYKEEGIVKEYLWQQDELFLGKYHTLVVCEGPFDALKVSVLGRDLGIIGTCVFTSYPTPAQIAALIALRKAFKQIIVLFDRGNEAGALKLAEILPFVRVMFMPAYADDPGELTDLSFITRESARAASQTSKSRSKGSR